MDVGADPPGPDQDPRRAGPPGCEQRHQIDLARENLVKTNLVIQGLELLIGVPSREPAGEQTTGLAIRSARSRPLVLAPTWGCVPFGPRTRSGFSVGKD
jgi:hypothetical protein